ncbi:HD domain-containing protein [Fictibacillus enclensis]|uniref:HD domain-containing protein n=1 Tax=Fictibacillus enclensis TaxID=1017270 RepID=UPI0025A28F10|nr:HD domain-containing protein [Fictibacillus enclensis]MDM5201083.1 HD domain-containing protein [Fictibacillus enclensis]
MKIQQLDKMNAAIEMAAAAHQSQVRKGNKKPYISHPYFVGMLLLDAGCTEETVLAGILHDVIEDTDVTDEDIRSAFGYRVMEMVKGSSEPDKSQSWEARKKHTITYLQKEASVEVCQIVCADKLHNVLSLRKDLEKQGEAVWSHFKRGRDLQEWYYTSLVEALGRRVGTFPLFLQLKKEVQSLFHHY